jgi:hypothetical protein
MYSTEVKIYYQTKTCPQTPIAPLFTMAKNGNNPNANHQMNGSIVV